MKVLLLGSTGLLGHNVLQRLSATGHQVVTVVRRRNALQVVPPDATIIEGSITHRDTVIAAARGCDAIINCAGVTDMSLLRYEDFTKVNTDLCHSLIAAMNTHGIKRLVHISTVNTIGFGTPTHPAEEEKVIKAPFDKSFYALSKLDGELAVREEARQHPDWHAVVINPGYLIGPMDVKPSSGKMLLLGYRRPMMVAPRGGKAFVDVRDVAVTAVNALTMGQNGERYIAVNSAGQFSISDLYILQAHIMGYRQHVISLPNGLLRLAGWLGDLARTVGIRTSLSTCNVQQLMVNEYYDNSRACRELALPQTDIATAIRDFHRWRETHTTTRIKY